jgi:2-methylcitrate dehydratase PrpD
MTSGNLDSDSLAIAEQFAAVLSSLSVGDLPDKAKEIAVNDLLDMAGLCIATREKDYMAALIEGCEAEGQCTALGHARTFDASSAAMINGVATHGEDFDDTLEGAPIRVGAMVIPAVLAACERFGRSGADALLGITAGLEAVCRLNHVAPGAIHKAGFHPVGVIGTLGGTVGAGVALGLDARQLTMAIGISGSMASGILEYLTEGAWTKRLHPGWAASSGLKAALLGRAGFFGPRTIFEGAHNFFHAFAPGATPRYGYITENLGKEWLMEKIAFKPYACGTMIHPYIDCTIRLAEEGVNADDIVGIECETGEGLVHRLWEPLADKHRPPSGYAAKFSMPFCMAVGFFDGDAGLDQFTDEKARDQRILDLAAKIKYVIDPENEYPDNYSGHIRVAMKDGSVRELRQPHMRGGVHEPLSRDELIVKFRSNIAYGGWAIERGEQLLNFCVTVEGRDDLKGLADFRGE